MAKTHTFKGALQMRFN